MNEISENYKIKITEKSSVIASLRQLIRELAKINKVVILIDEYDKPLIDNLRAGKENIFIENREFLKAFYSVFKEMDEYLKFVLLTGVSKFSKAGVFSGLNQLQDITMDTRFADLLGWTQDELENNFQKEIKDLAQTEKTSEKATIAKIKHWYNGYQFSEDLDKKVYNPFSTLLLFQRQQFAFHWFESGTPTFLIDLIKRENYDITNLESFKARESAFSSYEIENLDVLALLFQVGYLTIKDYNHKKRLYTLGYPNFEVQNAFLDVLSKSYTKANLGVTSYAVDFEEYLKESDFDNFFKLLRSLFANIPYDIHVRHEKYYQTVFYLIFTLIGMEDDIECEVRTNIGRIDAVLELQDKVFIFEFKLGGSKEEALSQIKEKKYYLPYVKTSGSKGNKKQIYLVGVEFSFDVRERNIGAWVVEEMNN